ncbi:MAG: hypothetical protein ABH824_06655 [Nanoarchaeota archaeon]|nr:hypothetical protein [Nanoarchaeota archaeon]MBU1631724.1 hypothetical protein [Nanoarchaeota archaeon]MBU1876214.1 hypothetical protein [Nanoarchaeota archaeon]
MKLRQVTLRYNGLFDFDGLYSAVIDWAKNYGYMWQETSYKHKVPSPKGAEQELDWILTKKVTDYMSYELKLTVHAWDMMEVNVDVDGRKKSLSNARIYILINGKLTTDWQNKFKGGKIAEIIGKWYGKVMKRDIETAYFDTLYYRMWNLHAIMKKYFDMQSKKYAYKGYLGEN